MSKSKTAPVFTRDHRVNGRQYKQGESAASLDAGLRNHLTRRRVVWDAPATAPAVRSAVDARHVGGGWYELPNGERVQGRDAAEERLNEGEE